MLVMFRFSFASSKNLRLDYVWTIENYLTFFEVKFYSPLLLRSLLIAAIVALISVLISYPAAWIIARAAEHRKNFLIILLIIPWWASYIVRVFAWYTLFGNNGVINKALILLNLSKDPLSFFGFGMPAVIITEINLYLPLTILPIYMTLERIDLNMVFAARSLGAKKWYAFWRVVFPLSLPGVIAAIIFVFMPVAGTFVVPQLVGGTKGLMIGKVIASQFGGASNWAFGATLAIILLIALLIALTLLSMARKRFGGAYY
jgi:spermidine/putrescine transport system permease protein